MTLFHDQIRNEERKRGRRWWSNRLPPSPRDGRPAGEGMLERKGVPLNWDSESVREYLRKRYGESGVATSGV